jgi:uncharacterized membrane protein
MSPTSAAAAVTLSTPYPGIAVQPGSTATFELLLDATEPAQLDLAVDGVPDGWTARLRGGGMEVSTVSVDPAAPPELQLAVSVPADAEEGPNTLTVTASGSAGSATLALNVNVAAAAGGSVELTTDVPVQRGSSDLTFPFTVELRNDTPAQLTFSLQAVGPSGWQVTAQPTGQERAASFSVDAGASQSIDVEAVPPENVEAGTYAIGVQAVGSGGRNAAIELNVEITGRVAMTLSTADERLNTQATAGSATDLSLVITNEGTAPLGGLTLTAAPPSGWDVTFDPASIDAVAAGQAATVLASISPSGDAIAGDYVVTLTAQNDEASESIDIRVTVETSPVWGVIGLLLIAVALGGLYWAFRRFGRR